jgi:hypothetical protein
VGYGLERNLSPKTRGEAIYHDAVEREVDRIITGSSRGEKNS